MTDPTVDPLAAALLETAREHPYSGVREVCACGWRGGASRHMEHIAERQAAALATEGDAIARP